MQPDEHLSRYVAQLSALPRWNRLEALREIRDPALLQRVMLTLPIEVYSEILSESFLDNLKRNVQERMGEQTPHNLAT